MRTRLLSLVHVLVVPATLVTLWYILSDDSHSIYFPPLRKLVETFVDVWFFEHFEGDLLPSVQRFFIGFALASVAGIAGGIVLGLSPRLRRDLFPITEYLRATPVVALIPIALVLFGLGANYEIALAAFGAWWPVLVSTTAGVRGVDPTMQETARVYGLSPRRRIWNLTLPAAMPAIFAGLRIAVSTAIAVVLVANMYASSSGLGFFVINAQLSFHVADTWAGLFIMGVLGLVANGLIVLVQMRVLAWHRGWRTAGVTAT